MAENFNRNPVIDALPLKVRPEVLVAGPSAVQIAVQERTGSHEEALRKVELIVGGDAYSYLREQTTWEDSRGEEESLQHNTEPLRVARIGSERHAALAGRGWKSKRLGLLVMGMPDIYAQAQETGDDMTAEGIRKWLHNPGLPPLPDHMLQYEHADIQSCIPEFLLSDSEAPTLLRLAANGLFMVYTLYGHPTIRRANQIVGRLERAEYRVPALYHNGFGLKRDVRQLMRHDANVSLCSIDSLLDVAADPYTDAVYGNGRESDNPEIYDELLSAELLASHAILLGLSSKRAKLLKARVIDTGYNEHTRKQRGVRSADPGARRLCGSDLQTLASEECVLDSFYIAGENGFSARAGARTIGKVLVERYGYRITSFGQLLPAIDEHANERPKDAPNGPTVKQTFAYDLLGSSSFARTHEFPYDWTMDNRALRNKHADKLEEIGKGLLTDKMTVSQAYAVAIDYTNNLRA